MIDISKLGLPKDVSDAFNKFADLYGINTKQRVAAFLAQVSHESNGFKSIIENLNYSAARLVQVFPKRIDAATAKRIERNPELIANHVYGGRMGNTQTGDGYKFRGRGYIMLTGKDNYSDMAKKFGMDLDDFVKYLETPAGAMRSAMQYWVDHECNQCMDKSLFKSVTQKINGGSIGAGARFDLYQKYLLLL